MSRDHKYHEPPEPFLGTERWLKRISDQLDHLIELVAKPVPPAGDPKPGDEAGEAKPVEITEPAPATVKAAAPVKPATRTTAASRSTTAKKS